MKVLALDLGTTTGWALIEGGRVESGTALFDVRRGESPGMRYVKFNRWIEGMVPPGPMGLIAYEQAHQRGGAATEIAAGFATRVQEFCARRAIEHVAVHTATLKKFATGYGNAGKGEVIIAVNGRWARPGRPPVTDDNEADAIALLHYALATYGEGRDGH